MTAGCAESQWTGGWYVSFSPRPCPILEFPVICVTEGPEQSNPILWLCFTIIFTWVSGSRKSFPNSRSGEDILWLTWHDIRLLSYCFVYFGIAWFTYGNTYYFKLNFDRIIANLMKFHVLNLCDLFCNLLFTISYRSIVSWPLSVWTLKQRRTIALPCLVSIYLFIHFLFICFEFGDASVRVCNDLLCPSDPYGDSKIGPFYV